MATSESLSAPKRRTKAAPELPPLILAYVTLVTVTADPDEVSHSAYLRAEELADPRHGGHYKGSDDAWTARFGLVVATAPEGAARLLRNQFDSWARSCGSDGSLYSLRVAYSDGCGPSFNFPYRDARSYITA